MQQIILRDLKLIPGQSLSCLRPQIAAQLGIPQDAMGHVEILRESLDARKKGRIYLQYAVEVSFKEECSLDLSGYERPKEQEIAALVRGKRTICGRAVVVGSGPCGLFAAYLLAREGLRPLILERGARMEEREESVEQLKREGILDPECNVCFGEGGAGAFSDGKLTTRIKDHRASQILDILIRHGAPEEIRYQAKPHMGTEYIRSAVVSLRREIEALDGEFVYGARLADILTKGDRLTGLVYERKGCKMRIETDCICLAIGHSARDTMEMLLRRGVEMEQKPFAMGVRVEHRRDLIDRRQYGEYAKVLGAADYRLTAKSQGRGVYSFCMCPGGEVICSATEPGRTAVNGMSYHARNSEFSNSAIVVSVAKGDMQPGPLGGISLQRQIEQAAFRMAGGYGAPVQRFCDFAEGRPSKGIGGRSCSYQPYVVEGDLNDCLPTDISSAIKEGFQSFERSIPGFATQGLLIGVETRTSSPVRILRSGTYESSIRGLYPAGEGAGYAGGIVSSAVDGWRIAEQILATFGG